MTFANAYKYAMEHSSVFRAHDAKVKEAQANMEPSGCMVFSVAPGEVFYYGFDGSDILKGKHTRKRAETLTHNDRVLIIL